MIYIWEPEHPEFVTHYRAAARVIRPARGRRTKEEIAQAAAEAQEADAGLTPVDTIGSLSQSQSETETEFGPGSDLDPSAEEASIEEVRAVFAETEGEGSMPATRQAPAAAPAPAPSGDASGSGNGNGHGNGNGAKPVLSS